MRPEVIIEAERLTLGVLLAGVAALSFSDFVSPAYWGLVVLAAAMRLWRGTRCSISEMMASLIGWVGFAWVGLELLLGRDFLVAFTDFLLILALAVVIEAPTPRNHLHRLIVGLFLILAAAVLTDSVLYALPLAAFVLLMWRAARRLYGIGVAGGDLPLGNWQADIRAFFAMLAATACLFVLVPRVGYGTLLQNIQRHLVTSGFSDRVQLGDFARELDPTVVMRVEASDMPADELRRRLQGRYWRGLALVQYVRGGWRHLSEKTVRTWPTGSTARLGHAGGWPLTVYREAMDHAYVFVPEGMIALAGAPQALSLDAAGALSLARRPQRRLRLALILRDDAGLPGLRPPTAGELKAPPSAVLRDWAVQVAGEGGSKREQLKRLTAELRSWQYDLNAPIDAAHPVEHFIRTSHRGHCELFATTLALAARTLGIPARVVNGYYGGEWNEFGGFLLIRQQHAHSWVEAWVDGHWQRFDPTPASRWSLSGVRFAAFDHVWESVKLAWYRYVLEFRNENRAALWRQLRRWLETHAVWAAGLLAAAVLAWAGSRMDWHRQPAWPVLDRWLARRGFHRRPALPLRQVPPPQGVEAASWRRFVEEWERRAYSTAGGMKRHELRFRLRALSRARW